MRQGQLQFMLLLYPGEASTVLGVVVQMESPNGMHPPILRDIGMLSRRVRGQ
jgi:hypothetical protein